MRVATIAVCLLVLSAGCVGDTSVPANPDETEEVVTKTKPTPQEPKTPSSERYNVDVEEIENLIHQKMNEHREENGLEPLTRNESLDAVARYKSWDMAQRDYFAHTGPNGTEHTDLRGRYGSDCGYTGQNLQKQVFTAEESYPYPQSKLYDSDQIATDAVTSLLNSPGHRENALSPHYDSQGIGVFVDENGTVFVTQELCG
ncbi:CAP domain-containing protein [Halolamina rubra]|uniref:CAP domain-containing protein n=1 Tax=Halolamina rubra TaxID=1380430 RepID=UPI0009E4CAAB|nr:CAP domain-containing protein [Halolamina rubra]